MNQIQKQFLHSHHICWETPAQLVLMGTSFSVSVLFFYRGELGSLVLQPASEKKGSNVGRQLVDFVKGYLAL